MSDRLLQALLSNAPIASLLGKLAKIYDAVSFVNDFRSKDRFQNVF
jgi:hypothetical protein